jgi:hypothetical protein
MAYQVLLVMLSTITDKMIFELDKYGLKMVWNDFPETKVVTNKNVIESGYLINETYFMDTKGYCFKIHEISKVKRFLPYWEAIFMFKFWFKIFFTISREPYKQMIFLEFKEIIRRYVKESKSYYENILMYDKIKKQIDSANSFEEIANILGN